MNQLIARYSKIKHIGRTYLFYMIILFSILNVVGLVLPLSMKKIYALVMEQHSISSVTVIVTVAFVANIFEAMMRYSRYVCLKWIGSKYEYRMGNLLVEAYLKEEEVTGVASDRMANRSFLQVDQEMMHFRTRYIFYITIDFPFILIYLYLIYLYGHYLVLVPIGILLLYMMITLWLRQGETSKKSKREEITRALKNEFLDAIEKMQVIKGIGLEEMEIKRYNSRLKDLNHFNYKANVKEIFPRVIEDNLAQLSIFLILIGGSFLYVDGHVGFAQIIVCVMLSGRVMAPFQNLFKYVIEARSVRENEGRLEERLEKIDNQEAPKEFQLNENYIQGRIRGNHLKVFDERQGESIDINFEIPAYSSVYIDSDKHPYIRDILLMVQGNKAMGDGQILLDNYDLSTLSKTDINATISYVDNDIDIFNGSIIDNISYFEPNRIESAYYTAAFTGLSDVVSEMPEGFLSELNSANKGNLPISFIQRLNLTRALVDPNPILIFDSIDESMDQETLEIYQWILTKLKGEMTIVAITKNDNIKFMLSPIALE